jgi:hypothetical protein
LENSFQRKKNVSSGQKWRRKVTFKGPELT